MATGFADARRQWMGTERPGRFAALLIALAVTLPAAPAVADTFDVTNTHDSGPGSLRRAILRANQNGDGYDTVRILATGTLRIDQHTATIPPLESDLAIRGPGVHEFAIYLATYGKGLVVEPNRSVRVRKITIERGSPGIRVGSGADLHVSRVLIRDGFSAAIFGESGASLDVANSTFRDNYGEAGGIFADGPTTISRSSFMGNWGGSGGAIFGSDTTISQSTFSNNLGMVPSGGTLPYWTGVVGSEGALDVRASTFSGNPAPALINYGDEPMTIESTILADSVWDECATATNPYGNSGDYVSEGHNLADDDSCNLTSTGDQPNTEPQLLPLDFYGGPTKTFALSSTSPAIDAGFADATTTDQRGMPRIVDYPGIPMAVGGDNSDVGAFELEVP